LVFVWSGKPSRRRRWCRPKSWWPTGWRCLSLRTYTIVGPSKWYSMKYSVNRNNLLHNSQSVRIFQYEILRQQQWSTTQ
jgi:hypothetical protein